MKKLMILCLLLAFAGCGKKEETMVSPEPAASTPPVQTAASVPVPASTEEPERLWESNIFGKSLGAMVQEGITGKLLRTPEDVRDRFRGTLARVINEGANGLICLIL
jgi:hypothetical protein